MKSKLLVFSGAGLSADSGIATFRDSDGLWAQYDPDKVCHIKTWLDNYELVHEFYGKRRAELANVEPNAGHYVLARLQQKYGPERVQIWTQNIDDLLEQAGAVEVKHVHGFLSDMTCTGCGDVWSVGYQADIELYCPTCGCSTIKPKVIFFGEVAPIYGNMMIEFHEARKIGDNTIVVIGTSGNVVPMDWIVGRGTDPAFKILVNKEPIAGDMSIYNMCFISTMVEAAENMELALTDRMEGKLTKEFMY